MATQSSIHWGFPGSSAAMQGSPVAYVHLCFRHKKRVKFPENQVLSPWKQYSAPLRVRCPSVVSCVICAM